MLEDGLRFAYCDAGLRGMGFGVGLQTVKWKYPIGIVDFVCCTPSHCGSHTDDGEQKMGPRPQVYRRRCVTTSLDVLALIVLVAPGDASVGKSSLLVHLTDRRFMTNPDPTVRAEPGSRIPCLATDLISHSSASNSAPS